MLWSTVDSRKRIQALHLAAKRGDVQTLSRLLDRSSFSPVYHLTQLSILKWLSTTLVKELVKKSFRLLSFLVRAKFALCRESATGASLLHTAVAAERSNIFDFQSIRMMLTLMKKFKFHIFRQKQCNFVFFFTS